MLFLCKPRAWALAFVPAAALLMALTPSVRADETWSEPAGSLSLREVGALVLARHPSLRSFDWELRADEARRLQADQKLNPSLELELENFSGQLPGASESELTLSVSQTLERGGKRSARVAAADAEARVHRIEFDLARRDALAKAASRYLDVVVAERTLALHDESVEIAEEVRTAVAAKTRAGAVSPAEEMRALVDLQRARLRRDEIATERDVARRRLAALWGSLEPRFTVLTTGFDSLSTPFSPDALVGRLDESPSLALQAANLASRERAVELADALKSTDLTLGGGVRRVGEADAITFLVSAGLELPLFGRSAGTVEEARAEVGRAGALSAGDRIEQSLAFRQALAEMTRSGQAVETLRRETLPAVERVFEEIRLGYGNGRFTYVDLMEARRAWTETHFDELDALRAHHQARFEAEQILGAPLGSPSFEEEEE